MSKTPGRSFLAPQSDWVVFRGVGAHVPPPHSLHPLGPGKAFEAIWPSRNRDLVGDARTQVRSAFRIIGASRRRGLRRFRGFRGLRGAPGGPGGPISPAPPNERLRYLARSSKRKTTLSRPLLQKMIKKWIVQNKHKEIKKTLRNKGFRSKKWDHV